MTRTPPGRCMPPPLAQAGRWASADAQRLLPHSLGIACLLALALGAPDSGQAQTPKPDLPGSAPAKVDYALGVALAYSPTYGGGENYELKPRPVFAVRYGRFRIATSRGSALLGYGAGAGISADLVESERFRIGASLRGDSGRAADDDPALAGLPEIRRTLRGRVYATYALTSNWGLGLTVSQDLLSRGGGATASTDLSYVYRLTPKTEWRASAGLGLGNSQYMRTYYGVSGASAAQTSYAAFDPGGGLTDVHASLGITSALSDRWVVFGGLGVSRLQGDAAASPLTRRATGYSGSIGLVYRCCN